MEKEFVPYEQALILKKLGFDEQCFRKYYKDENGVGLVGGDCSNTSIKEYYNYKNSHCSAPLYQQAFTFFREKFNLDGRVMSWTEGGKVVWYFSSEAVGKPSIYRGYVCTAETHEIAQFELIQDLIKKAKAL